jgi:D-3-phosphoglycerate dehydrogenase/C-terminal binding protein
MAVAFYDPYVPPGIERALGFARAASIGELIAGADVLSLHTPLTAETARLIDAAALARARPELILVNTARGAVVDLDALEAALREDRIAGAALDVLPEEPIDYDHPLIRAWAGDEPWLDGRFVVTPHAAFYSPDGLADMRRLTVRTIVDHATSGELRSCVNRALLDPARRR